MANTKAPAIFLLLLICSSSLATSTEKLLQVTPSELQHRLLQIKAQSTYAIDDVLSILAELRDASIREFDTLNENWGKESHELQTLIRELQEALDQQRDTCNGLDADLETLEEQLQESEDHVKWIHNRREEINQLQLDLAEQRCEANLVFIDRLKDYKESLAAIGAFRKIFNAHWEAQNFSPRIAASLVQKLQSIGALSEEQLARLTDIANRIPEFNFMEREQWEDNDKEGLEIRNNNIGHRDINTDNLADAIHQVLDELESHLSSSSKKIIEAEVEANSNFVDFKIASEAELEQLAEDLEDEKNLIESLHQLITVQEGNIDECQNTLAGIEEALTAAKVDLNNREEIFDRENERLDEEIEQFSGIYNLYRTQVNDDGHNHGKEQPEHESLHHHDYSIESYDEEDEEEVEANIGLNLIAEESFSLRKLSWYL